jgi:hypothetical protein
MEREEMKTEAVERAALEKARAEQLDRASLDEMLPSCARISPEHGWTVRPPRKQK